MKKNLIGPLVIILIMIATVIIVLSTTDIHHLLSIFDISKLKWYLLALFFSIMVWVTDALHLQTLSIGLSDKKKFGAFFKFTMIGFFYNSLTPFYSGGQPAQVYYMSKSGTSTGHAITILLIKSAIFQVVLTLYSIIAFIFNKNYLINIIPHFMIFFIIGTLISCAVIAGFAIVILRHDTAVRLANFIFRILAKIRIIKDVEKSKAKLENEMDFFKDGISILRKKIGTMLLACFYQAATLTFLFLIPYAIYLAVESGHVSALSFIANQATMIVIVHMVPMPGASGGSEGVSYLFFKNIFTTAPIVAVILLWRIFTFYINIIGGGIVYAFVPDKKHKSAQ